MKIEVLHLIAEKLIDLESDFHMLAIKKHIPKAIRIATQATIDECWKAVFDASMANTKKDYESFVWHGEEAKMLLPLVMAQLQDLKKG